MSPQVEKYTRNQRDPLYYLLTVATLAIASLGMMIFWAPEIARREFPFDDAWIHLVYARGLLQDGLPTYNNGIAETGFSSPLWMIAAIPGYLLSRFSLPIPIAIKLTTAVLGAIAAMGAAMVTKQVSENRTGPFLTIAFIYLWPNFIFSTVSGMEVTLTAACLIWSIYFHLKGIDEWAGVFMGLACISRPECTVALLAMVLGMGLKNSRGPKLVPLVKVVLPAFILGLIWFGYNYFVSGYLLPNTFYVKGRMNLSDNIRLVIPQVFLGDAPAPALFFSLILSIGLVNLLRLPKNARPDGGRKIQVILFVAFAGLVSVLLSRPVFDHITFFQQRYYTPFSFLIFPVLGAFFTSRTYLPLKPFLKISIAFSILIVCAAAILEVREIYFEHCREIHILHTAPALKIKHNTLKSEVVAVEGAGSMRFHSDRFIVDLLGLNDHRIAHASDPEFLCILRKYNPSVVAVPTQWTPKMNEMFLLHPVSVFNVENSRFSANRGPRSLSVFTASFRPSIFTHCAEPPNIRSRK